MSSTRFFACLPLLVLSALIWPSPALPAIVGSPATETGAAVIAPTGTTVPAELVLPLNAYLDQVRAGNHSIRSAEAGIRAIELSLRETQAVFDPYLAAEVYRYDSQAPSVNVFAGSRTLNYTGTVGVSKRWGTGTSASLGYKTDWTELWYLSAYSLPGLPPGFGNLGSLFTTFNPSYTSAPTLSVSQSLWKDFLGRGTLAGIARAEAGAKSAQFMNRYAIQQTLFAAKQAYLLLALTRANVQLQEDSLQRNTKILEWTQRRVAQNLADPVDALQTEARVQQTEINLAQAREELRNVVQQFNLLRNQEGRQEAEPLERIAVPEVQPEKVRDRLDVLAAEYDLQAKQAAVIEVNDRTRPDLSLYGSASFVGRDDTYQEALNQSFSSYYPVTTLGIKLNVNLDGSLNASTTEGAQQAEAASRSALEQKRLDLARDWENLRSRWQSVNLRLRAATTLERLQKEKAEREKVRFRNGRTTNFQVLQFDDDYAQSQLQRLRLLAEAWTVLMQTDLYNGGAE
jgi:outer membrane protein TolC